MAGRGLVLDDASLGIQRRKQRDGDEHFNEAVRKCTERFEDRVRDLSPINDIGRSLMVKAFANDDYLNIGLIEPENQQSFTEGYRFLSMGMMAMIRILIIAPMGPLIVSLSSVCLILLVFPSVFLYNNGRRCRHGS